MSYLGGWGSYAMLLLACGLALDNSSVPRLDLPGHEELLLSLQCYPDPYSEAFRRRMKDMTDLWRGSTEEYLYSFHEPRNIPQEHTV